VSDIQPPETRRARLWRLAESRNVPLRAIMAAIAAIALTYSAWRVIDKLRGVLLLLVVAGFIALLLNPLVVVLQRYLRRRGFAVAVVTLLGLAAFGGLAFAFGYPLVNGLTHLATNLPNYVNTAEHGKGWVGKLVTKYHLHQWVQKNAPKLVTYGRDLATPALSLGAGAVSIVFELFTIFVLTVLLMLEGPKMRSSALGMMTPARAARVSEVAGDVNRSVTGFMLGNFATSLIAGLVVLITLMALGVPFPFLLALWVGLVDFLPMIGGALAGIPVVLFAFTHSLSAGIVTLVVFLIYTQVENHILNPVIMSRTVRINPLIVLVSILVGASIGNWIGGFFGGFVAALLSIPAAGAVQIILRAFWQSTASGPPPPPRQTATGLAGPATGSAGAEPGRAAVTTAGAEPGRAAVTTAGAEPATD
jgi:predicted PurR-regulated permease PerM